MSESEADWGLSVDVVVVGAGAAGALLAHRLVVEGGLEVALLEAGPSDSDPAIHATDVASMQSLWGSSPWCWPFETLPQPHLAGRRIAMAQGRGLGGGTSINAMMYVRGNRRDFDGWAAAGAAGWSYEEVLPFFKRTESYAGGDPEYRGRSGELQVIDMPRASRAAQAFLEAARAGGWSRFEGDYNAQHHAENAALVQSTRRSLEQRESSASAFLDSLRGNPRLHLIAEAQVARVLLERGRAVGVEATVAGSPFLVRARREVVLCAGALWSPHLLMHSGVGPAEQLRRFGVEVRCDLPGVGAQLHDHVSVALTYRAKVALEAPQLLAEALLFCDSGASERASASPDLQFFFAPIRFPETPAHGGADGFAVVPILAQPRSRGSVRLGSSDPSAAPLVDPAYLSDPLDAEVLLRGLKIARKIASQAAFDGIRGAELAPGAKVESDEGLLEYLRGAASTVWHPVGTCAMGSPEDPMAVVDPQLRVRGLAGLRVADASVMPRITSGNTQAATYMIGERAAAAILAEALT